MRPTVKLYYERPELAAAEAQVLAVEGGPEAPVLILDRTLFYPEGGGQPCDLGTIGGVSLASAAEEGGIVRHRLGGPSSAVAGDRLALLLDERRRRDHSQQHTGQHLLSATLLRIAKAPTVSFHLGEARCTIDVDHPLLDEGELAAAAEEIDRVIAADYPILIHLCPPEDIASFPLRRAPPQGEESLRVVEIDGLDYTPCCGTHLRSTGAIRALGILGAERYKGMTRVSFVAGDRACADYRAVSRIAREAARALGSSSEGLPAAAARAAARQKELEYAAVFLRRERASLEAELSIARGEVGPALLRLGDRGAAEALEAAKAYAARGRTALAASLPELTVLAIAAKAGERLGEKLKPLAAAAGGKGGGGDLSFRAAFPSAAELERFLGAAWEELSGTGTPGTEAPATGEMGTPGTGAKP